MSTTTKLMTADELWRLPKVDKLYELVQGELITKSPAGFDHGAIGVYPGFECRVDEIFA